MAWTLRLVVTLFIFGSTLFAQVDESFRIFTPSIKSNRIVDFLMEIPSGSSNKYEFRTNSGQLFLDRVICPREVIGTDRIISKFPVSYGIVPGRFNIDGDPLDLNVLGSESFYASYEGQKTVPARKVRVIGIVQMEECSKIPCKEWDQDWKVLAVDLEDSVYKDIFDVTDISSKKRQEISDFFSSYKGTQLVDGKVYPLTRVAGFLNVKQAEEFVSTFEVSTSEKRLAEINHCRTIYSEVAKLLPKLNSTDIVVNKDFLNCSKRVLPVELLALEDREAYLKFSAMQILQLEFDDKEANFGNSLLRMEERRQQKKKYFRFVTYDLPLPGTGNAIFDWVKTLNRNEGCPVGTAPQHYDSQPITYEFLAKSK